MANTTANHFKYLVMTGVIHCLTDQFKIILMESGFVFNKDTHHNYADVVGDELPTLNGYSQGAKILAGVVVTEDDANDRCEIAWNNPTWTAAGGDIGPASGAIIYDDTVANDPIAGYIDFGGDYSEANGGVAALGSVGLRLA